MSKKIIVFIDTHFNKYWSKSVLGKTYDINIGGIPMLLHFPSLPREWCDKSKKDHLNYPLLSPNICEMYKIKDDNKCKDIIYGYPCSYPAGSSIIEKLVISFEIENKEIDKGYDKIYAEIEKTMNTFYKLCYIVNDSMHLGHIEKESDYEINMYDHMLNKIIQNNRVCAINLHIPDDKDSISKRQLDIILSIINSKVNIPAEYDFLISAIKAYENHDNRKCILDLSTACEISITSKIEKLQSSLGIKNMLDDYPSLYNKYKLLSLLNYDTSFADIKVITRVRNKAIHSGKKIDSEHACDAIKVSRTILKKLSTFY